MDISEQNLKNNVNNMIEKNEDPSDVPVKPSVPSDPSADLDNNLKNKGNGDEKQDRQILNELQDTENLIKPENSPTHPPETSPSPQFECPFEGCGQRFSTESELIAHMDKESADARESLGK
ncbi:MAG: C2H2-type zinc finger protein [Candidatus Nitrosopolaris sp.]